MKILLTGANGQLGHEIAEQGKSLSFDILSTDLQDLDITNKNQVQHTFDAFHPALVINAAAYTNVDRAEIEPKTAFAINAEGPDILANACMKADIPMIHISTDYVFNGKKKTPYLETDPVSPLGVYGSSKEAGEAKMRDQLKKHIIIRTAWLYSVHGHNFIKTMLKLFKQKTKLTVVDDQYGSPTSAQDLANAVLIIAGCVQRKQDQKWGTYHYCGQGETTWYEFACTILEMAKPYNGFQTNEIEPIATEQYPTPAKRPQYSALNCNRIKKNFNIDTKIWQDSLAVSIKQIMSTKMP